MIQSISESFWAKTSIALILLLAMTGVWAYLSGAFLLLAFDKDYNSANLVTYYMMKEHGRSLGLSASQLEKNDLVIECP